jgi:dUTP pyrophosphatase
MDLRFRKFDDRAVVPFYATPGDAGLDLTAIDIVHEDDYSIHYSLGIGVEIPEGYEGQIRARSSIRKYDLVLANGVGTIDSGYRGVIQVSFRKLKRYDVKVYDIGDRVAQLIIAPVVKVNLIEVDELSTTDRGEGGHGHTGN